MSEKRVLVVLGHRLELGDKPSSILRSRMCQTANVLETKIEEAMPFRVCVHERRPYDAVVLCGGKPLSNQSISEAALMKHMLDGYCIDIPVPVYLDEESKDTLENLRNATDILMAEFPSDTFVLEFVTDEWHYRRTHTYWQKSKFLQLARTRCRLAIRQPLVLHTQRSSLKDQVFNRVKDLIVRIDPERRLANLVRPHHA